MKTICDAAGIAGKRGVRILIPAHHRVPESDSQRRLAPHPGASSGPPAPQGREFCVVEVKFSFGASSASFEWMCAFFCEIIRICNVMCNVPCDTEMQSSRFFGPWWGLWTRNTISSPFLRACVRLAMASWLRGNGFCLYKQKQNVSTEGTVAGFKPATSTVAV